MSAARSYSSSQSSGSAVAGLLNPVKGYRDSLKRRGIAPRNHAKENMASLRRQQEANRESKDRAADKDGSKFVMKRFRDVRSRVEEPKKQPESSRPTTERRTFLRKSSADEGAKSGTSQSPRPASPSSEAAYVRPAAASGRKAAVPRANDVNPLAPRSERNFVAHNRREATEVAVAKESAGEAEAELHEHFGQVPDYLLKRQEKWNVAEEKRIAQLPDKDCPPGMSLMPDEERQETLNVLLKSQGVAKDQLRRMPLVVETQGQVRRKNELDAKLKEIEEAIVIFSREKVFVKD